jgi:hypothetical protein
MISAHRSTLARDRQESSETLAAEAAWKPANMQRWSDKRWSEKYVDITPYRLEERENVLAYRDIELT